MILHSHKNDHLTSLVTMRYLFDGFEFNNNGLFYKQKRIHLPPKESNILQFFLKHPNSVQSKDTLIKAGWGHGLPSDESLTRCIYVLRNTLYSCTGKNYIKTLYKKGYFFKENVFCIEGKEKKVHIAIFLPKSSNHQYIHLLKNSIIDNLLHYEKKGIFVIPLSLTDSLNDIFELKKRTNNKVNYFITGYFFNNEKSFHLELIDANQMILIHSVNLCIPLVKDLKSISKRTIEFLVKKITSTNPP
ncbi:winged helix-turn-helix domain-containing protein [Citrobacter sp. wls826]|uniref:winged helix-turn-helix domain-containing protein n=1 Tax=Citrobacter sp. wls826 TaxID=2576415 RepID=UPI0010C9EE1B|nr:winged helix-turn-helix domain-containing protein [Citrobacter sp. wls826]TKU26098.1 hypothetical protein FDW87_00075 [Citrobacter sp. wls826]TKV30125.1 hypothetical protein FDX20_27305 [Citrobacter sp. TBCS-11]